MLTRIVQMVAVSAATESTTTSSRLLWKKATYPASAANAAQVWMPAPG